MIVLSISVANLLSAQAFQTYIRNFKFITPKLMTSTLTNERLLLHHLKTMALYWTWIHHSNISITIIVFMLMNVINLW